MSIFGFKMSIFGIKETDLVWESFENEFHVPRSNVVEVNGIFRHPCRLYVDKDDLKLWDDRHNPENADKISYYELTTNGKWIRRIYKN